MDMNGEHLAWAVTHLHGLLEASLLVGNALVILIAMLGFYQGRPSALVQQPGPWRSSTAPRAYVRRRPR